MTAITRGPFAVHRLIDCGQSAYQRALVGA
jgi:hypothetical protein